MTQIAKKQSELEVFTDGGPVSEAVLAMVRKATAECNCTVVPRRIDRRDAADRAEQLDIERVPSVAVDGRVVFRGRPEHRELNELLSEGGSCVFDLLR